MESSYEVKKFRMRSQMKNMSMNNEIPCNPMSVINEKMPCYPAPNPHPS
jgi:hypothetical protein